MEIRDLHYFVTLAESGSITAAAKQLHISQPPLSVQLKKLEEELGTALFIRGSRKVKLTEPGEVLYQRAKLIIDNVNSVSKEVHDLGQGMLGTIRLGVASSCGTFFLSLISGNFKEKNPNINFELTELNTYDLIDRLNDNSIDLAIIRTPYELPNGYSSKLLLEDNMLVAVKPNCFPVIEDLSTVKIQDLETLPLITYKRWAQIITRLFKKNNLKPSFYCINEDARTTIEWASLGLGVAVVPSSITGLMTQGLITRLLDEPSLSTNVYIVWKNTTYLPVYIKNLLEIMNFL